MGREHRVWLAGLAVGWLACHGDDDGGGPAQGCPRATITEADEVVSRVEALPWVHFGPYGPRDPMAITDDLWTTAEIVLDGAAVEAPAECALRPDCRPDVRFLMEEPVSGVSLEGGPDGEIGWLPDRPTLRARVGASLRLRPLLYDTHPDLYNFVALVLVLPSCFRTCAPGTLRCEADAVCYAAGETACSSCDLRGAPACACAGVEEGAACDWFSSGDLVSEGTCQQGECL